MVKVLPAAGDAQQHLGLLALARRGDQFGDRRRLVARWLVFGHELNGLPPSTFSGRCGLWGTKLPEVSGSSRPAADDEFGHGANMGVRDAFRNKSLAGAACPARTSLGANHL